MYKRSDIVRKEFLLVARKPNKRTYIVFGLEVILQVTYSFIFCFVLEDGTLSTPETVIFLRLHTRLDVEAGSIPETIHLSSLLTPPLRLS